MKAKRHNGWTTPGIPDGIRHLANGIVRDKSGLTFCDIITTASSPEFGNENNADKKLSNDYLSFIYNTGNPEGGSFRKRLADIFGYDTGGSGGTVWDRMLGGNTDWFLRMDWLTDGSGEPYNLAKGVSGKTEPILKDYFRRLEASAKLDMTGKQWLKQLLDMKEQARLLTNNLTTLSAVGEVAAAVGTKTYQKAVKSCQFIAWVAAPAFLYGILIDLMNHVNMDKVTYGTFRKMIESILYCMFIIWMQTAQNKWMENMKNTGYMTTHDDFSGKMATYFQNGTGYRGESAVSDMCMYDIESINKVLDTCPSYATGLRPGYRFREMPTIPWSSAYRMFMHIYLEFLGELLFNPVHLDERGNRKFRDYLVDYGYFNWPGRSNIRHDKAVFGSTGLWLANNVGAGEGKLVGLYSDELFD